MHYALLVLAGAMLCNSLPHLAAGLQGMPFPSPFSKPPGEGDSSPPVNVLWGLFNLLVGWWIVSTHPVSFGLNPDFLALFAGVVLLGVWISIHFGKVQARKRGRP
jgi:hypothetical protein